MRAQLFRRLVNLEIRKQAQLAPRKAPFPKWLIEEWQAQNIPIDDHGIFDWTLWKPGAGGEGAI